MGKLPFTIFLLFIIVSAEPRKRRLQKKCSICGRTAAASSDLCELCERTQCQAENRSASFSGLKKQGDRMVLRSTKEFAPISVGENVRIGIPNEDRQKAGARNIIGVVMNEINGFYTIGTAMGIINRKFLRQMLAPIAERFVDLNNIPNVEVSLRQSAGHSEPRLASNRTFCNCQKSCGTRSCACRKQNALCNSSCHESSSCLNK